jgi:hypothetical protein
MRTIALALGLTVLAGAVEIPRKAGDIDITLPDGKKVNIADYHGKVLCLAFILTT